MGEVHRNWYQWNMYESSYF